MKIFVIKCTCCHNNIEVDFVKKTAKAIRPARPVAYRKIVDIVCEFDGFTVEQLSVKCRKREQVLARQKIFWLAKHYCKISTYEMADFFGGRDHTTALHGINTINDLLDSDDRLRAEIAAHCEQIDQIRYHRPAVAAEMQ